MNLDEKTSDGQKNVVKNSSNFCQAYIILRKSECSKNIECLFLPTKVKYYDIE